MDLINSQPENLLTYATLLPLIGFALVILIGGRLNRPVACSWFTVFNMLASFAASAAALVKFMSGPRQAICVAWNWLPVGVSPDGSTRFLQVGPYVDEVTVVLFAMVTLISLLVHLYSVGYMAGDPHQSRFMAYMQLFTFSMLGIVLGNSLLQLFIFWELVGLSSYLLIGFWYEKRGPQLACKKAYVMNRIGDMGFLIGMGIIAWRFGGDLILRSAQPGQGVFGSLLLNFNGGLDPMHAGANEWWLTLAGIGLFMGAMGKSAQFPLHTWLPDAMEGPTPVSSIVHSATMVAAGVYLTARIFPILTPAAHLFVATIGLITLVMAAVIACAQTDIKRVLAYSTLSQLGYMILALGAGSYTYALFHLVTHAFFKCCLFQCSGSVIHAAHHNQDLRSYGGLARKMPLTALAFFVCTLAIAGASIPWTNLALSGFYSKDGIIAASSNYSTALTGNGWRWAWLFVLAPTIIAYVTPFYMTRAFVLTFLGKPRDRALYDHAHEAPWTMWLPQIILAAFAVVVGWSFFGVGSAIAATAPAADQGFDHEALHSGYSFVHSALLNGLGWIIAMGAGFILYLPGTAIASRLVSIPGIRLLHWVVYNKFGFDGLYDVVFVSIFKWIANLIAGFDRLVVDGIVNLVGWLGQQIGFAVGGFDDSIVDGAVRGSGRSAVRLGMAFHHVQSGNVRNYVLVFVSTAIIMLAIAIPFTLGWWAFALPSG